MTDGRRWLTLFGVAGVVFALDQISKALVIDQLALGQSWAPVPALADIFQITRSANTGAAFSIFQGANTPLLLLALAMLGGIVVMYRNTPPGRALQQFALGLLLGGVAGNALDRLRLGTVVDFIHWQLPRVVSNVSNLADHAIVLSVLLLVIAQGRTPAPDTPGAPPETKTV